MNSSLEIINEYHKCEMDFKFQLVPNARQIRDIYDMGLIRTGCALCCSFFSRFICVLLHSHRAYFTSCVCVCLGIIIIISIAGSTIFSLRGHLICRFR